MTCVAGIAERGKVWLGADSAAIYDNEVDIRSTPKVFVRGAFIVGVSDSWRIINLLAHTFNPPERGKKRSVIRYLCTEFVTALRDCLKDNGCLCRTRGVDTMQAQVLIGYQGRLFDVDEDFQVGEPRKPYLAIGAGAAYALGSLHTTNTLDVKPEERLGLALSAAEAFSTAVAKPFRIVCGGKKKT